MSKILEPGSQKGQKGEGGFLQSGLKTDYSRKEAVVKAIELKRDQTIRKHLQSAREHRNSGGSQAYFIRFPTVKVMW